MAQENKDERGYNGWSNYPTWNVKLWLDNDQGLYNAVQDMARRASNKHLSDLSGATVMLAQELQAFVEELLPDLGASFASDLLGWAVGQTNWYEMAQNIMEDIE